MKKWVHKIELFVDKIIPVLLVILIGIIVIELWFHVFFEKYFLVIEVLDWFIVSVFVVDLLFKYVRSKKIGLFLKTSWLDILAVFPFFLLFRFIEGLVTAGETISGLQKIVHASVEVEKEFGFTLKEGERIAKEGARTERFAKFLRPFGRSFRFLKMGNALPIKKEKKESESSRFFHSLQFFERPR